MTTILVAEYDRDIEELVVDTLFDKGYDILDGFAVVKKLKENILTELIPVVMLTAMGALDGEQNALNLGVKHYASKPFDPDLFLATMRVALR